MHIKWGALLMIFFLCQLSFAETCLDTKNVKNNKLSGWKIIDSEDGLPLSAKRADQFRQDIEAFVLAEWMQDKNNTVHCYYRNKDGYDMEAFLTKENFMPNNMQQFWYQVSGSMQCAAGAAKCEFKSIEKVSTLAKR